MLSHFPTWSVRKPDNTRADAVCKVGGAPIGWSRDWPVCALCSLPMSFLGQFTGDPLAPRLPVGQTLFLLDSWLTAPRAKRPTQKTFPAPSSWMVTRHRSRTSAWTASVSS